MAKKQKLTKEQKKMSHAQAVSGNGSKANPYYPTDYSVGKRNPKKEEKPMVETARPLTTKQWVGTLVILLIPIVNIIALIAWANKNNGKINPSKRTFAKAYLIVWAISLVVAIIIAAVIVVVSLLLFPFPATADEAIAMLEEANYFVDVYEDEDAKIVTLNENVETYLIAKNEEGEIELTMYFFSSEETATEYYDSLGEIETEEYSIVGINANIVYIATEEAADAINGNGLF